MTETPQATQTHESPPGPQNLGNYEELRRSTTDRKIAGVAGGLGRHLNVDPTVLRVLLVVLCFFGGAGFVVYGAAWLLVPEDGAQRAKIPTQPGTRNALLIGTGIVAGLLLLGNSWGGPGVPWPVILVGIGVLVYLALRDRSGRPAVLPSGATPQQPPAPPWAPVAQAPTSYPTPSRPRRGPKLFGFTLAVTAVALGSLGLYDASGGHVLDSAYPALGLAVVGLMLVVGAFVGRAGGLILLGILAVIALAATSVGSTIDGYGGHDGERLHAAPASASTVKDSYFVPAGRLVLDLSGVGDPQDLAGRSIEVGARAGEVVVILPRGIVSDVDADVTGPGQVDLPTRSSSGFDSRVTDSYGAGAATVSIRAHLFAGHIDVRNP